MLAPDDRPRLARGFRLRRDRVRDRDILLGAERGWVLNQTGARVVAALAGERTLAELASMVGGDDLARQRDVIRFVEALAERGIIECTP
jgi:pyrroloquinoline-quinone synthase/pyrroloquinoline quinone biosynthesis protein D